MRIHNSLLLPARVILGKDVFRATLLQNSLNVLLANDLHRRDNISDNLGYQCHSDILPGMHPTSSYVGLNFQGQGNMSPPSIGDYICMRWIEHIY